MQPNGLKWTAQSELARACRAAIRWTRRGGRAVGWMSAIALLLAVSGHVPRNQAGSVHVVEGPIPLRSSAPGMSDARTFGYLVQGERGVFWSSAPYGPSPPVAYGLVAQRPWRGSSLRTYVTTIPLDEPGFSDRTHPQLIRSPDGYIHIFVGVERRTENPRVDSGRIRYFRSERPDDIASLVERTELVPHAPPFEHYGLMMQAGISRDGSRMALVTLAVSPTGAIAHNTPVLLVGDRRGHDFVFRPPVQYAEPMGRFYGQVAATESGIVVYGAASDDQGRGPVTERVLHVDWRGTMLHREDFPADGLEQRSGFDLRPAGTDTWDGLVISRSRTPRTRTVTTYEIWEYDVRVRRLRLLRSLEVPYDNAKGGKWLPVSEGRSLYVDSVSAGGLRFWEGDVLGEG
ncbi:hypothetical protein HOI71_20540, partial [Candidatus Poribacteria bacterium]|nr:hypothetical protein [Candidatus Poribacteria bacterium]